MKACLLCPLLLLSLSLFAACGPQDPLLSPEDPTGSRTRLAGPMPYRGVNLAGADFGVASDGTGNNPGSFGTTYTWPDAAYVPGYTSPAYFLGRGMTVFRLPFRWERLQPSRRAPFSAAELDRMRTTVANLTGQGAAVLIDPHNYARYGTAFIGSSSVPNSDFADFWSRLADEFKGNPNVLFGLMNEPYGLPTEQWVTSANAAIAAIRATGATNLILVPGNAWSGAHSWSESWYGTSNATALLNIVDPGNNVAFEAHQYLDGNGGGTTGSCVSPTIGSQRMQPFTAWLRAHNKKGFLGEFATGDSPTCLAALEDLLSYLDANADVYLGWTYWAAGPWWGSAWTSLEPRSMGLDTPQMAVLRAHLAPAGAAPSCTDGVRNGAETGVDCGGACAACPPAPSCTDGVRNGAETGVDCGGACAACPPAPSCTDGVRNGAETGVDCGGACAACPPAPSCQATTYEAEAVFHSSGGSVRDGWNLWSNGYLETPHHAFPPAATTLTVVARGDYAGGVSPRMRVLVGTSLLGTERELSTRWAPYTFRVPAGASGPLRVAFDNDVILGAEDRNLYVDKLITECAAPPPPCAGTTYQAEAMAHSTGGATAGGWNLWSNGFATTTHDFAAGPTAVVVTARGSPAGGVWPRMRVSVAGVVVGTVSVNAPNWQPFTIAFTATAGPQELRLAFDNDAIIGGDDRNLYLDQVVVGCPAP